MRPSQLFFFVILVAIALKSTQAIRSFECEVFDNTSGTPDTRFRSEVGIDYALDALFEATEFVLEELGQSDTGGRGYHYVLLVVESFLANGRDFAMATTNGSHILVNADFLQNFPGNLREEFTGIVYYASGLVWEWTGNGSAPIGLQTGIAAYMRLKAGWGYDRWPPRGSGLRWDEGYVVTAYFLEYCAGFRPGFVSYLNTLMIDSYNDVYFVEIFGKSVDELWEDYKSEYGGSGPAPAPAQISGD